MGKISHIMDDKRYSFTLNIKYFNCIVDIGNILDSWPSWAYNTTRESNNGT